MRGPFAALRMRRDESLSPPWNMLPATCLPTCDKILPQSKSSVQLATQIETSAKNLVRPTLIPQGRIHGHQRHERNSSSVGPGDLDASLFGDGPSGQAASAGARFFRSAAARDRPGQERLLVAQAGN